MTVRTVRELSEKERQLLIEAALPTYPITSERMKKLEVHAIRLGDTLASGDFPEDTITQQGFVVREIQELRHLLEYAERLTRSQWSTKQWLTISLVALILSIITYHLVISF